MPGIIGNSCRAPDPQQMRKLIDEANGPILELLSEQNKLLAQILERLPAKDAVDLPPDTILMKHTSVDA